MSSSDALWLNIWGAFAAIGFIIVIIGVIIEGVEHFKKFPRKEQARKLQIEKIGWFMVVAGLAMEFLGDSAAKRISDRETSRLNKEASDARKDAGAAIERAGIAEKEAGQANERAALIESNNLVLRTNVVALELKIKPRAINAKQMSDFIFLTEKITKKIPIVVHASSSGDDTYSFSSQIRKMLDKAGFLRDTSQNGIELDSQSRIYTTPARDVGETGDIAPVMFLNRSANKTQNTISMICENINGFGRPIVSGQDELMVYEALSYCFNQIGIKTSWMESGGKFTGNDAVIEIYIPAKNY